MRERRVFTVEEVNALIPSLSQLVGRQILRQSDIEQRLAELAQLAGPDLSLEAVCSDSERVGLLKLDLKKRIRRYNSGWRRIQSLGAVVKDPNIGLVDFYGLVDGRLVWLCWRYGEERLSFYHELNAGYANRRPLCDGALERWLN